ncbi:MAG: hypothetical protein HOK41_09740 [Nitrospina sp.]|nr:hypothetical protein [Nitrospina sp.]
MKKNVAWALSEMQMIPLFTTQTGSISLSNGFSQPELDAGSPTEARDTRGR